MAHIERTNKYTCLIFDADHTLLDYLSDEKAAFAALYRELDMPYSEELANFSRRASEETWTAAGMYDVHDETVQKRYHHVYREHVEDIFKRIFEKYGYPKNGISPKAAGEKFLRNLENAGKLLAGAEETLAELAEKYVVCIATNGLSSIQRGRLQPIEKYARGIYISEETGAIKPLPAFFERIFKDWQVEPKDCLMIGDSLSSDIAGARAVGMDCCWFNPHGQENASSFIPDYEITSLRELENFL